MDKKRLSSIQTILDECVATTQLAGANVLIYQNGEEQYYCESGYADLEQKKPMKRDSIFRLFSMTKPVTGAAAMILMERGAFDLFEPVSKYLPAFRETKLWNGKEFVAPKREITIKDLLGMVSGLPYKGDGSNPVQKEIMDLYDNPNSAGITTLQFADRVAAAGVIYEPGTFFEYGTSADIVGALVESVSGMRFSEFLSRELFNPLGMKDTAFYVPEEKLGRLANPYVCKDGKAELYAKEPGLESPSLTSPPAFEAGGAGLFSTADDYMQFATMLLNGGASPDGKQILSPRTVDYFASAQLTKQQLRGIEQNWYGLTGYSFGNFMRVMVDPGQAVMNGSVGEYGWDGWMGCYFVNSPKDRLTFILNMQQPDAGTHPITRRIRNVCWASL